MKASWITIYVKNMEESLKFYTEIIGLEIAHRSSPQEGLDIAFLNAGGIQVELIYDSNKLEFSIGKDISLGLTVESLELTIKDIKEKGVKTIIGPISPSPHISFIFVFDPNGFKIQIAEQSF
jgi:lactoylglutathione lyase